MGKACDGENLDCTQSWQGREGVCLWCHLGQQRRQLCVQPPRPPPVQKKAPTCAEALSPAMQLRPRASQPLPGPQVGVALPSDRVEQLSGVTSGALIAHSRRSRRLSLPPRAAFVGRGGCSGRCKWLSTTFSDIQRGTFIRPRLLTSASAIHFVLFFLAALSRRGCPENDK